MQAERATSIFLARRHVLRLGFAGSPQWRPQQHSYFVRQAAMPAESLACSRGLSRAFYARSPASSLRGAVHAISLWCHHLHQRDSEHIVDILTLLSYPRRVSLLLVFRQDFSPDLTAANNTTVQATWQRLCAWTEDACGDDWEIGCVCARTYLRAKSIAGGAAADAGNTT